MSNASLDISVNQVLATLLDKANRIVIKIGSALVFDPQVGQADALWMTALGHDIAMLRAKGKQIILVSSGAIALGRERLKLGQGSIRLEQKQAAAATGQVELAQKWQSALGAYDIQTAQILLAPEDTETRRRHLNARATTSTLLELGVVPIVNENDTITTYEIRFGDNDRLAARVAAMISADLLILLSDVDGLYTSNPHHDDTAELIPEINEISDEILSMGGVSHQGFASGGMTTKLSAAKIATQAGVAMLICNGQNIRPISALLNGGRFSLFHAQTTPTTARKNWIAGALNPKGAIALDKGAAAALVAGKSLLPVGVTSLTGPFERGDLVTLLGPDGGVLGHGLAGYSFLEADRLKGQKSSDFEKLVGYEGRAELIHADDLVLTTPSAKPLGSLSDGK